MHRSVICQLSRMPKQIALGGLGAWQLLRRAFFGPAPVCRFVPTCSQYAKEALCEHGVAKGGFLTIKRLAKCHPLCKGGVDLVPTKEKK